MDNLKALQVSQVYLCPCWYWLDPACHWSFRPRSSKSWSSRPSQGSTQWCCVRHESAIPACTCV